LAEGVEATLKASEASSDRIDDLRQLLKPGDVIEAKIVNLDRKTRAIALSIRAKDAVDQKQALKELRKQEAEAVSPTTIGDLIKAQMENQG
jgi:small subunit ribosomal protein S1